MFVFFSELLGRNVYATTGRVAGRLADLKMRLGDPFPKITSLIFRRRFGKLSELPWDEVAAINGSRIHLRDAAAERAYTMRAATTGELLLRDELLDKQVVDTGGAKIERVNDLHFLINHGELRLVHVDVGLRGIVRRLGWLRSVDGATNWLFAYQLPDQLISWKYVQPLSGDPLLKNLKLNVTLRRLSDIHPSDLADILEELDCHRRNMLLQSLDVSAAADAIEEMETKAAVSLMEDVSEKKASDIIREMEPDEAADLLDDLPDERKETLISSIETEKRRELEELLSYREGTAGSLMTSEPITIPSTATTGEALDLVRSLAADRELIYYVYVVDADGALAGVVTMRSILTHSSSTPVAGVMTPNPIAVGVEDDVEDVAAIFKKYNFMSVPVIDEQRRLKGLVTWRDALEAVIPEFAEK